MSAARNHSLIAAVICCHNRCDTTLSCLAALYAARLPQGVGLETVLVDDGSTDGTAVRAMAAYPEIALVRGDGTLYWNGATRLGMEAAARRRAVKWFLWLNDDTTLDPNALSLLLDTELAMQRDGTSQSIVVGTTRDPYTGLPTYGGVEFPYWYRRTTPRLIWPGSEPKVVSTVNGNCVLIPRTVYERVGNLDPVFVHTMADFDYGLRASAMGIRVVVAPGFVGSCSPNKRKNAFLDPQLPLTQRLSLLMGPKGRPPRPWLAYTRRHGGALWPFLWVSPYPRVLLSWMWSRLRVVFGSR